jgi:hypothetical protein
MHSAVWSLVEMECWLVLLTNFSTLPYNVISFQKLSGVSGAPYITLAT